MKSFMNTVQVRVEVARQMRAAAADAAAGRSQYKIELYETDPRKENAMPLSAQATLDAMRRSVFCVTPTGDSDGFTQAQQQQHHNNNSITTTTASQQQQAIQMASRRHNNNSP